MVARFISRVLARGALGFLVPGSVAYACDTNYCKEYARACRANGGIPSFYPARCDFPSQPPVLTYPTEDREFTRQKNEHRDLVQRLRSMPVRLTGRPSSTDELGSQLDEIGAILSGRIDFAWSAWVWNRERLDVHNAALRDLPREMQFHRRSIKRYDGERAELEAEARAMDQRSTRLERDVAIARRLASDYSTETVELRRSVVELMYVASPADSTVVAKEAWRNAGHIPQAALPPLPTAATYPTAGLAPGAALPRAIERYPQTLPAVEGTVDARLEAVRQRIVILEKIEAESAGTAREASGIEAEAKRLMREAEALAEQYGDSDRLRERARQARGLAENKVIASRLRLEGAVGGLVARAVENFVWATVKAQIVRPEVWRFIEENKAWYKLASATRITDDEVKRHIAQGKSVLDIGISNAKGYERFLRTQQRVLDLLDQERLILEAPRLLAMAAHGEIAEFERDFSSRMQRAGLAIGEAAQGQKLTISMNDLPPPIRAIARKMNLVAMPDE